MNYGTTNQRRSIMDGDEIAAGLIALAIFLLIALSLSGLGAR